MADGTGLMAFWARIDEGYLARFRQWHNSEHMPERVSIPGFLAGQRYLSHGTSNYFLMMYETQDPTVLGGPDYLARLNAPTPWTRESLPHFREPARNIYRRLAALGKSDLFAAPCLASVRFNADAPPRARACSRSTARSRASRPRSAGSTAAARASSATCSSSSARSARATKARRCASSSPKPPRTGATSFLTSSPSITS